MLPRSPLARVSIMRLAWCWLHSLSASSMPCHDVANEMSSRTKYYIPGGINLAWCCLHSQSALSILIPMAPGS